ncbi:hypothetical protein BHM03_00039578 [Ensete ventricosum]|nr:hypothetical protein BHM03_00039578 [Ensete ventricosum]
MSSYLSTTPVVLTVRRAPACEGCRPYLCQVDCTTTAAPISALDRLPVSGRPRRRASCPRVRGRGGQSELAGFGERMNSSTNLGDLVERMNSGTNPGDLAERTNSGTNPEDLVERENSGTNPGDLVERANSGTNPADLAERANSGTNLGIRLLHMTSFFCPQRRVSVEVEAHLMRWADHDLDTIVIEGSLAMIRERYNIPVEYGLHVSQPGQRPYSSDAPDMCISVDALEVGLRFPLHSLIEECLRWWRISPSQVAPNSWRYLVVFLGECRGIGWISTSCVGCPRFSSGKAPPTRAATREVGSSPAREAPKASSKRPVDVSAEQAVDAAKRHKKIKVLTRRHKSRLSEEGSRSRSKGKEPAAPSEEPDTPAESEEGGASPIRRRPRSMKDLFKTKVKKDDAGYYTLLMSNLGHQDPEKEMKARWKG